MFKHIKTLIIGLIIFCVIFTFMPTGSSGNQVVSGFKQMSAGAVAQQQGSLVAAHTNYIIDPTYDGDPGSDPIVGELREAIVQLNIQMCLQFGSGYKADDGTNTLHTNSDTGLLYSCTQVSGWYGTFEEAKQRHDALIAGTGSKTYFSCHGSCYYTWNYFWDGAPYVKGSDVPDWICPATGHATDQSTEVSKLYTDTATMLAELQPGDIIWNSCDGNNCPYHDSPSSMAHSQIYLGTIEVEGHTITNAYRNTGGNSNANQWCIKPMYDMCSSSHHKYYVVSLTRAIKYVQSIGGKVANQPWSPNVVMPSENSDGGGTP